MGYINNLRLDIIENVLVNLRRYQEEDLPFCDHLKRNIPQALSKLDNQIEQLEKQVVGIREETKQRIAEKIDAKKYTEVRGYQESQAAKIEPLNTQIDNLKRLKKEITKGLKADQKRRQDQAKTEADARLERKRDHYSNETGFFNGYKTPSNLIEAIRVLYNILQPASSGTGHRVSLAEKLELFLGIPRRHENLIQLRKELESAGAANDLYDIPTLDKELLDSISKTQYRAESILGYDPTTHRLRRGILGPVVTKVKPDRLELQQRRNEQAKRELMKEGLIPNDKVRELAQAQAE